MMQPHITFLGGGNMANAIVAGLISHGHIPAHIHVVDRNAFKRETLAHLYGIQTSNDPVAAVATADIVIFSIKPQGFSALITEVGPQIIDRNPILVSIMSGIRIETLASHFPNQSILRAMPNTPARVQAGMTLLAPGSRMTAEQLTIVEHIFDAVGHTIITPTERVFEQLTALTGCGPAFVYYFVDMFAKAMQEMTPDIECLPLSIATFQGALTLMQKEPDSSPDALIAQVSPKGGMTAEAMKVLQTAEIQALLKQTFQAAIKRGDELANS
ncbi:MAG: pyrroline-5-carboxylate reductase [Gammaproteobacteria bacterium]